MDQWNATAMTFICYIFYYCYIIGFHISSHCSNVDANLKPCLQAGLICFIHMDLMTASFLVFIVTGLKG